MSCEPATMCRTDVAAHGSGPSILTMLAGCVAYRDTAS